MLIALPTPATDWVAADPFRAHLRFLLRATGLPWRALALQAGVSPALVRSLLFGRRGRRVTRLNQTSARRLLQLTPGVLAGLSRAPGRGKATRELVVALLGRGVDAEALAAFCRVDRAHLLALRDGRAGFVSARTELLVETAAHAAGLILWEDADDDGLESVELATPAARAA